MGLKELKKLFWSKKVFLFDLDGTLYLGNRVIPRAKALLKRLESQGKQIFYFTNNSSRSVNDYVSKLTKMGFSCRPHQVVMSTHTLISELQRDDVRRIFLLGTPAMRKMLSLGGISTAEYSQAQAVVVGFDKTLTYKKFERAAFLIHQGLPFYVTHPDLFCPTDEGPQPDCGAMAAALSLVTGKKAKKILGKPHPLMIREVMKRVKCRKSEMIIIGDRVATDLMLAKQAGIDGILVLSGDSKREELKKPDFKSFSAVQSVANLL